MKKSNAKFVVWSVAVLSVAAANGVRAQQTSSENLLNTTAPLAPNTEPNKGYNAAMPPFGSSKDYPSVSDTGYATSGPATKCDRATGIIGMDVKNQNNQRLGKIKDVVFDMNSERVAYAVLEVQKKPFAAHSKYLAVPINAFRVSGNQNYLVLNADKQKMEMAQGFDRNHWPSATNPSWGAQPFWQSDMNQMNRAEPETHYPSDLDRQNNPPEQVTPTAPVNKDEQR